jgi:PAS domain S-box-containing protein
MHGERGSMDEAVRPADAGFVNFRWEPEARGCRNSPLGGIRSTCPDQPGGDGHQPLALALFDEKGIIRYTNGAFDGVFGYPRGSLRGRRLAIVDPHPIEEHASIMAGIILEARTHGCWRGTLLCRHADGRPFDAPASVQSLDVGGRRLWAIVHETAPSATPPIVPSRLAAAAAQP